MSGHERTPGGNDEDRVPEADEDFGQTANTNGLRLYRARAMGAFRALRAIINANGVQIREAVGYVRAVMTRLEDLYQIVQAGVVEQRQAGRVIAADLDRAKARIDELTAAVTRLERDGVPALVPHRVPEEAEAGAGAVPDPVGSLPDVVVSVAGPVGSGPVQLVPGFVNEPVYYAFVGRRSGVTTSAAEMVAATNGFPGNYVAPFRGEAAAHAALARRLAEVAEAEPRFAGWAIFNGRDKETGSKFTGIVEDLEEHDVKVIGASGVRSRKFSSRAAAQAWLTKQEEQALALAGVRAEEAAYAAAHQPELEQEERYRYLRWEARRRMAAERNEVAAAEAERDGGRREERRAAAEEAGLPVPEGGADDEQEGGTELGHEPEEGWDDMGEGGTDETMG